MDFTRCKAAEQLKPADTPHENDPEFDEGLRDAQSLIALDMRRGHGYAAGWLSYHWMKPVSPRRH